MEKKKLTLERILELSTAVETVAGNDRLSGKTSYWLGRLGDFCSAPTKVYRSGQEKVINKIKPLQDALLKKRAGFNAEKSRNEIEECDREIQELNVQYSKELKEVLEQEEEIQVPEFKLSQFIAETDITYVDTVKENDKEGKEVTRKVEITVKKGQSLVPIRFFKLMGEFVLE